MYETEKCSNTGCIILYCVLVLYWVPFRLLNKKQAECGQSIAFEDFNVKNACSVHRNHLNLGHAICDSVHFEKLCCWNCSFSDSLFSCSSEHSIYQKWIIHGFSIRWPNSLQCLSNISVLCFAYVLSFDVCGGHLLTVFIFHALEDSLLPSTQKTYLYRCTSILNFISFLFI